MQPDQARRVLSNFSWGAAAEVAGRVIGLAVAVYLARVLGAPLYGAVGVTLALVGIFEILVRAGTGPLGIRGVALAPASIPALHARIMGLRLVLAAFSLLLFWTTAPALAHWLSVPDALIRLYSLMILAPALTTAWVLRGLERMDVVARGAVAQRLLVLAGVLLLVRNGSVDLLRLPVIEAGAALLMVMWYRFRVSREHGPLRIRFEASEWRKMAPETLPVTLSALLGLVYIHGDVLLLGWLSDTGNAGRFLAAQKIVLTLLLMSGLLNRAAFPATSQLVAEAPTKALSLHAALYRYLMLVVVPVAVAGGFFASDLLALLFGGAFTAALPVLVILLLTLPLVALGDSLKHLLLASRMGNRLMLGVGVGAGVHLLLAVVLIPQWHMTGAAVACLAGEAAGLCVLLVLTHAACGGVPLRRLSAAPFAAGAVMAVALASGHDWEWIPRLAVAIAAYAATAGLLRTVSPGEWRMAARLLVTARDREPSPAPK